MIIRTFQLPTVFLASFLLVACEQSGSGVSSEAEQVLATIEEAAEVPKDAVAASATQGDEPEENSVKTDQTESAALELEWDDLIPADWRLDKLTEKYDLANLDDDDPRAAEALADLQTFWKESPVVDDYNGKLIKLPGFMVPLDPNVDFVLEFLLVPYYGACIHTPPPPANQTIYVATAEDKPYPGGMFDTVWVTGKLVVEKIDSTYGTAGYRIEALDVVPYE